jgi:hypothetical protein
VMHTFSAAPVTLGYDNRLGGNIGYSSSPPQPVSLSATLELANALAANSATTVSAETGGFNFAGGADAGGVLGFSTGGFASPGMTSNLNAYVVGSSPNTVRINRYATLDGTLTTDAIGNVSAWDLRYVLREISGGSGEIWTGPGPQPANFPTLSLSNTDMFTNLSSASRLLNINVFVLDGVQATATLNATVFDEGFGDPGPIQLHRFNTARGVWSAPDTPGLPVPGAIWLSLVGFGVLLSRTSR